MTDPKDEARKPDPRDADEDAEIADRLSSLFGGDGDETGADAPAEPRIRLDKTGALADRPKLQPKKPYARDDEPPAEDQRVRPLDDEGRPGAPRKATLPPPIGTLRPPGFENAPPKPPDDEVTIPGGAFLFGEEKEAREVPAFRIDRYPVRNVEYEVFVKATGHRPPLYWIDGKMPAELADHPVVGIDYFDALGYARWKGKDLPFEDEWERAARGTEGQTYPWGDEVELGQANTARLGLKMTMPIGWYEMNVSPDGVCDTMGNVWEITHSPAPGGGIVVRGGSWFDFVLYAKTWFRFASRPQARNGTIGFRCVRRMKQRPDAEREVPLDEVEAALEARRGPQPKVDVSTFSPERRDLAPDYRRLGQLMSEREEEEAEARDAALLGRVPVGRDRPLRAPVKATPPPRLRTPPKPPPATPAKPSPKSVAKAPPEPAPKPARPKSSEAAPAPSSPDETAVGRPAPVHVTTAPPSRPPAPPDTAPPGTRQPGTRQPDTRQPATRQPDAVEAGDAASGPGRLGFWLAAGAAMVLVAGLLAVLLMQGRPSGEGQSDPAASHGGLPSGEEANSGPGPDVDPPVSAATTRRQLPVPPREDPRDDQAPLWIDGGDRASLEPLEQGVWLVVFADLPGTSGRATVATASALHRALRDTPARLALVLPRSAFEDEGGRFLDERARRDRLEALGATADLTVILDPAASPPEGGAVRAAYGVLDPQAALVLVDGRRRHRTAPTEGGFSEASLEPLAARAAAIDER